MQLFNLVKIITISVLVVFASWIMVHLLAFFGIFGALAFPLWWILIPQKSVCLLCRAKPEGSKCPFCKKIISKHNLISPTSLTSALLNGSVLLAFSVISIAVVYGESQILLKMGFPPTVKTANFIIPSKGQYRLGEIFPMKIEIVNDQNAINTVQADIGYNPEAVEVVDISTLDSFANIFIQKEINNVAGWARLTGGLPNPGFVERTGNFGTVYFKSKSPGLVKINFLASSMVLANDGRGTNILREIPSGAYLILPDRISAEEELEQQKMYTESAVLGAKNTEVTQLTFYEPSAVLGNQITAQTQSEDKPGLLNALLSVLEKIDHLILDFWSKLVG